jgi:hypothetical protein
MSLSPSIRDQRKVDAEHLKLLAVFHFVLAALSFLGLGFLFLHWFLMHSVLENPEMLKNAKGAPPPKELFAIFQWIYLIMGVCVMACALGNLLSGLCLLKHRAKLFSFIVAGINCLGFPLGTILAVFTFMVLLRESVGELYAPAGVGPKPATPGEGGLDQARS